MRCTLAAAAALLCAPAAALPALAQEQRPEFATIQAHVLSPAMVQPDPESIRKLQMPDGFKIETFADGLINPRMLAVAPDGAVYVTRRRVGDVLMLRDTDGDGRADARRIVASRPQIHGIAINGDTMYLTSVTDVYRAAINDDGTLQPLKRIVADLPDGGQHPNRVLKFGPDGMIYLSVGSTCNACGETNQENAAMLAVTPDGVRRTIYASGLRNTIGYDWHPETGEMWGMDHGIDWLGDETQQEELNRIEQGKNYGWPYIYGDGDANLADAPPGGITAKQWQAMSEPMVIGYTAHAAPMQMLFYRGGQFPDEYRGDAFVTMRGSWNARPATGFEIVRIRFKDGKPQGFEPFIRGFLQKPDSEKPSAFARPVGLAFMPDGSMLFTDDTNGVIYRVTYDGPDRGQPPQFADSSPPANPVSQAVRQRMRQQTGQQAERQQQQQQQQLAGGILAPEQAALLNVVSPSFPSGGQIPLQNSAYGENISPALDWSRGPEGTKSYAVIMEDPDAGPVPNVHWIAYNIPGDVTFLREGLPTPPKLQEPNIMQGTVTSGRTGYWGPKPSDDAAHRYHFQVFALDRQLDINPGERKDAVLDAMKGHVLAKGEVAGHFRNPLAAMRVAIMSPQFQGGMMPGTPGGQDPQAGTSPETAGPQMGQMMQQQMYPEGPAAQQPSYGAYQPPRQPYQSRQQTFEPGAMPQQ